MKNTSGFSLIELMIVVAVMGILVAIAYPSYQNQLQKGTRAAAKSFLLDIVQREQAFLLDNRRYATYTELKNNGMAEPNEVKNFYTLPPATSDFVTSAGPPPTFSVTLRPIAGKRQVADGWLAIDQAGTKTSQYPNKW